MFGFPFQVYLCIFFSYRQLKEQKDMEDPKSVNLKVYNRDMDSPDSSGYVRRITVILTVNLNGITTFYCYPPPPPSPANMTNESNSFAVLYWAFPFSFYVLLISCSFVQWLYFSSFNLHRFFSLSSPSLSLSPTWTMPLPSLKCRWRSFSFRYVSLSQHEVNSPWDLPSTRLTSQRSKP